MKPPIAAFLVFSLIFPIIAQKLTRAIETPGQKPAGRLLPNGWTVTPEGKQIPTSDLPMSYERS